MATKKYRLKKEFGGYLALTSVGFGCIIRDGDELEPTAEEFERLKKYIEPIPIVRRKKKEESEIEKIVEDN